MTSPKGRWIPPLLVAALVALGAPRAVAEQQLHFRVPLPVSSTPFVVLQPGKTQLVQACATKALIDKLVLWPGQTVMVEYAWKAPGSSWPAPETLPTQEPLVSWLENNTKLCSAGVQVKHAAFNQNGIWDVTVSMHAQLKKQYEDPNPPPIGFSVLIGGETARIRVDPATLTKNPPTVMKATPVPVPPPTGTRSDRDKGPGQSWSQAPPATAGAAKAPQVAAPTPPAPAPDATTDALTRKLGQLAERLKTLERGGPRCSECGDLTRRVEGMRRQIVPGLPAVQAQQLTLEADRLGLEITRLEGARGLPAVQGAKPPQPPARAQPSAPAR